MRSRPGRHTGSGAPPVAPKPVTVPAATPPAATNPAPPDRRAAETPRVEGQPATPPAGAPTGNAGDATTQPVRTPEPGAAAPAAPETPAAGHPATTTRPSTAASPAEPTAPAEPQPSAAPAQPRRAPRPRRRPPRARSLRYRLDASGRSGRTRRRGTSCRCAGARPQGPRGPAPADQGHRLHDEDHAQEPGRRSAGPVPRATTRARRP